jgi:hypothetical protein
MTQQDDREARETGLILEIPWSQGKSQRIFADCAQSGDSGVDWRPPFKGLRQIPYAAGAGNFIDWRREFFHPSREFIVRRRECPHVTGFMNNKK